MSENCICGSAKTFARCCGRFLCDNQLAKTPEQLMRSRYSAYALGGYGDYLLRTWHPATSQGLTSPELSRKHHEWLHLEIVDRTQSGDSGVVEFKASHRAPNGAIQVLHERSSFTRIAGRWLYVGGEVSFEGEYST